MIDPRSNEAREYIGGVDYPVSKQSLVLTAESHNSTDDFVHALRQLDDRDYVDENDVIESVAEKLG